MRWIFFSLLLANVAFYLWHSVESEREARLEQLNASVATEGSKMAGRPLVLINELSNEEKQALADRPKQEKSTTLVAAPTDGMTAEVLPELQVEQDATGVAGAANAGEAEVEGEKAGGSGSAPPAEQPAVASNQCAMLGAVTGRQYDQIAQRLLARTIVPERVMVDVEGDMEYWVVLPPLSDSKAAVSKLQEIQGRGVQGQIIPGGKLENAISFGGVQARKSDAEAFAEKIRIKGLKVEVRGLPQVHQEKWVSLSARQSPKLTNELWLEIQQDFPHLEKRLFHCR